MLRKLKKYTPTPFKAKDSVYDKQAADHAVAFIECLSHTKGTWSGKSFLLIDWQEQIIRDVFGTGRCGTVMERAPVYTMAEDCWCFRKGTSG